MTDSSSVERVGAPSVPETRTVPVRYRVADFLHGRDHRARAAPAGAAAAAARLDRPRARRAAGGDHPEHPPRRRAAARRWATRCRPPRASAAATSSGRGRGLPPLLLDDSEAVAVAVSLRMAAGGTVSGASEAALRTLAKLDQVMPPRLRGEVRAIHEATQTLDYGQVTVDGDGLLRLARACPRHGAGPLRLRGPRQDAELPHRRAGRPGRHRPALVPDGLRRRPRRLAHLPARPDDLGGADDLAVPRARARGPGGVRPAGRGQRGVPLPGADRSCTRRCAEVAERTSVRSVVLTAVDDDTDAARGRRGDARTGWPSTCRSWAGSSRCRSRPSCGRRWPRWAAGPCGRPASPDAPVGSGPWVA